MVLKANKFKKLAVWSAALLALGGLLSACSKNESVAEAKEATGANVSVIFVPAAYTKKAVFEAVDAGIELVVVMVPRRTAKPGPIPRTHWMKCWTPMPHSQSLTSTTSSYRLPHPQHRCQRRSHPSRSPHQRSLQPGLLRFRNPSQPLQS